MLQMAASHQKAYNRTNLNGGPLQPTWAQPRTVAGLIAAYLLMHMALRLVMGSTLGLDDAEQALFAQHWLLNYRFRAPPLFTWMLVALSDVIGIGVLALSIIRYGLLALMLTFTYLTARRLIREKALAALSTFSFATIYLFGYFSHHDLTHTTALSALLAGSWYVFVRLCELPTMRWYLALGVCFGLGMLSKWNFLMFAIALLLTCLVFPAYRSLVLNWRVAGAGLVAIAIVLPSVLWALHVGPAAGDRVDNLLGRDQGPFIRNLAAGTFELAKGLLVYPQPFLTMFVIAFGREAWYGFRNGRPVNSATPRVPDSFVGVFMVIAIALHWLLIPLAGATNFEERLLQPALFMLPAYLFMLLERSGLPLCSISRYLKAVAVVIAATFVTRAAIYAAGADYCRGVCRAFAPFDAVATGLRNGGFNGQGSILASDFHIGGNLRLQFPNARVLQIGYPSTVWPRPSSMGQCLVVWTISPGTIDRVQDRMNSYLVSELRVGTIGRRSQGEIAAPMLGSKTRIYRLQYALFDTSQGECR
jgi:hypothetical protein